MRSIILLFTVVLLAGCGGNPSRPAGAGVVELNRELVIPANRARTVFEAGRQVDAGGKYVPHCEFEISTVSESPQVVKPDVFGVQRIGNRIVGDQDSGAPPSLFGRDAFFCIADMIYETDIRLASDIQPGVRRLLCRQTFDTCTGGRYLSLPEIQQILGSSFSFR